jgi:hypothetical protein
MAWYQVTAQEYESHRQTGLGVFHSARFNAMNAQKVERLEYWIYEDNKKRFGIILGYDGAVYKSPFSSPFGGIEALSKSLDIEKLNEAIQTLVDQFPQAIKLIVPPPFYNELLINYAVNGFLNKGFHTLHQDINYHFETKDLNSYESIIDRSARKNLNASLQIEHDFVLAQEEKEKAICYDIIKQNREQRGFPLRLSFEDVRAMEQLTRVYYNTLYMQGVAVAASICFEVSPEIVIVVYWGNLVQHAEFRPMNLMAYRLFHQMKEMAYAIVDVGPSTENGIPNYGLCKFKENIGCKTALKFTLLKPAHA